MLSNSSRPHARRGRPALARAACVTAIVALLLSPFGYPGMALAGPTGGQVVAGSGTIQRPSADTTLIQQQSQSLSIDWTGFDVAGHELVKFQQPSSSSAVLNRVFNELPSQIYGRIQANGQVFIMNPNGVVFGPGARVEVGGLMASSIDIDVEDFMNGHYRFAAPEGSVPGAVINSGLIRAATGGGVALLGGAVRNDGVIIADLGHVLMGAGRQALVDFDGDGLIRFHVDGAILENVSGQDAHEGSAVANNGEIYADGGQVLLSAAVARGIIDQAINNTGIIRAASIDRSPGVVRLSALGAGIENSGTIDVSASQPGVAGSVALTSDGDVLQRGRIHADAVDGDAGSVLLEGAGLTLLDSGNTISARASGGRGGEVRVLGESVAMLDAATIDVSGGFGGGTVLIGGDYQGANPSIANARLTGIAAGALINADATDRGDGGRVIVWSDDTTNYLGTISARGGASGGDGGFVEVSGKQHLAYRGSADLTAAMGSRGTLLLDPATLEITGGSGDADGDGDDSPARFAGDSPGSAAGAILFSSDEPSVVYQSEIEEQSRTADITLQATRSISTVGSFDGGALTLAPNSNLLMETRNAGSGETGLINLIGSSHGPDLNIVTAGTGTITVRSGVGGDRNTPILLPNLVSASDIHISAGGGASSSVLVFGTLSGANIAVDATGSVTVVAGARLVAGGDGTSLTVDARGITLLDGAPGAATISNSGTGAVSLRSSGAANILLGEYAIANGVGLLSLSSGRSILAINLTDVGEITSAGSVSLAAAEDIGSASERIEIIGATDLILNLDEGDFFVSGSDGAGGAGRALSHLTLSLAPQDDGNYVIENFAGQDFDFVRGTFGDDLVIHEIVSASLLDLSITTRDAGIVIGGGAGIALAGASNVTLDSQHGIEEVVFDDGVGVVAEITTDGRLTLVANSDIGGSGMLDLAAASTGVSVLQAVSRTGAVRVSAGDALRIEGDGVTAAAGGTLVAGSALNVAADMESGADMRLAAGDDLSIAANIDTGGGTLSLNAGGAIGQLAGSIAAAFLGSDSVGATTLDGPGNAVDGFAANAGGDVTLTNRVALAVGTSEVGGSLRIDNAEALSVGGGIKAAGGGSLSSEKAIDIAATVESGADMAFVAGDDLSIAANIDNDAGVLSLTAGGAIKQLAGRIAAASLRSDSGGATTLDQPGNAVGRFAAIAGADVGLKNSIAFAIGPSEVDGNLTIDSAETVSIADLVQVTGTATLTTTAGNIDGAGGRIAANHLHLDSAAGIGIAAVLNTAVAGDIFVRSRGAAGDGDIRIRQQGDLATSQFGLLATDASSTQTVSIAATDVLRVDEDPVDTPDLQSGDMLELDATRIELAGKISGKDVDIRFKGPVDVTGSSVFIDLDKGLLTFDANVSPGADTTLTISSQVAFASGHVTGKPGSSLVIDDTLNLVTNTTIEIDNLYLSGDPTSLTGSGSLTLLPATHGKDLVIGGDDGLAPDITLATLRGFGGGRELNIGVPAFPTSTSPFAGNVKVTAGLWVGDAVLTVGGLGDVTLNNHGDPLESDRAINIVAVGDRRVFPGLVSHDGGNILDSDASAGASATLKAPEVSLIAQGRVGSASNALEVAVGSGGHAGFVTGASDAFINTTPGGQSVTNISDTSTVLAAFQSQGFFLDPLNQAALGRTVGLETTGLQTTGLGELLYLDEGVFLLPDPYTTPVQATLLPALMDPDFPSNRRPDDPDDEEAWQSFFNGVLKDYVQSRYLLPDDASASQRAEVNDRIAAEWQSLVDYFQKVRSREHAAMATGATTAGSGG
jgi:filamentous hemagglutinin family protein